jgi:4-hydroxybenzoate polyprenyltransferase
MLLVAVIAAELLAGGLPSPAIFVISLVVPVTVSMGAFAINDYFDVEADRLNRKMRPLVTKDLTKEDAIWITAATLGVGILASALINPYAFAITLIFAALAVLYAYILKAVLLVGNAYVALSMVIPFIFGSYVVSTGVNNGIILISVMIFCSGLAREIQGTIRDYEGDVRARHAMTLPAVIGKQASAAVALAFYIIAVLVSAHLFFSVAPFMHDIAFGVLITLSDIMLLGVGTIYLSSDARKLYRMGRNVSLFAMFLALIAIVLAAAGI